MRYRASLVKEIIVELEKVPIIRHVCTKVNIDHSTFYRWMFTHPEFRRKVAMAQTLGRKRITDAAESVILTGIQNQKYKHAAFWLAHNEPRYMSSHKGRQYQEVLRQKYDSLFGEQDPEYPPTFEKLFDVYHKLEKDEYEPELIDHVIKPMVELLCIDDPRLVDVFFSAYANWKRDKENLQEKLKKMNPGNEMRSLQSPEVP